LIGRTAGSAAWGDNLAWRQAPATDYGVTSAPSPASAALDRTCRERSPLLSIVRLFTMPPFPYYRIPVLLFFWFADCTVLPFFFFSAFQYHHQTTPRTAET
jgi:hypothetical protein